METTSIRKFLQNWEDELNAVVLYQALTEVEKDPRIAEIYRRMAAVEQKHADNWAEQIKDAGGSLPVFKPSLRTRILVRLGRRFGVEMVLPSMQATEQKNSQQPGGIAAEERSHARLINQIVRTTKGGVEGGLLAQFEGRHRSTGGNALRAAVLGANDGLVSNLSLVMGVAGAAFESRTILITGLAGLLAGSCSMALGEWLSVQSSRELYSHQINVEADEIEHAPEEEAEELGLIYEARGLKKDQAQLLARQILENKKSALDTLAREELGIDPKELGGSAWEASITSFLLFALGAVIPVFPFIFLTGTPAILVSILLSTVGLFLLGSVITFFTGQSILYSGLRMVLLSLLAAAITFGIGRLIGIGLGG